MSTRPCSAACIVGEAVSSSLKSFFGSDSQSDDCADDCADDDDDEHEHEELSSTRAAERLTPQARLVASGAAHAVLHCAMGSHPLDSRVQLAGLRAVRALASPPCGEATRKDLGAMGALDRVAVAASLADVLINPTAADTTAVSSGSGTGRADDGGGVGAFVASKVSREAKLAMQALVDGCEQNMRHALSLGCGDMVW